MFSTPAPTQLLDFMKSGKKTRFVFFGSSSFSIYVLDELEKAGLLPAAVVTMQDKPTGRNLVMTRTEVKAWATARGIDALTPETLKDDSIVQLLKKYSADVFIVASYGKIIPESVLYLPKHKTLNVHPSLLPLYRGASPVQSMILANEPHPGVSIMELDKEMDHGPIVASKEMIPPGWPISEETAIEYFGREGGKLLSSLLYDWVADKIKTIPQDHTKATYTKKIQKTDAQLDLSGDPFLNYLKILAYHHWPKAFFFDEYNGRTIRLIVTEAGFDKEQDKLDIKKVIPEGKKEMTYADYLKGKKK